MIKVTISQFSESFPYVRLDTHFLNSKSLALVEWDKDLYTYSSRGKNIIIIFQFYILDESVGVSRERSELYEELSSFMF